MGHALAVVFAIGWKEIFLNFSLLIIVFFCKLLDSMSKSTRNTAFRKVDVDQFEEEKYEEEVVTDEGVTGPNDAEVQSLLSKYPLIADKTPHSRTWSAKRRV